MRSDNVGTYTFANAVQNSTGASQTVTIQNTGGLDLTSIQVTKGAGGNPGDFTLNTTGIAANLAANATTTFTVTFTPTSVGSKTATIQIASSDATQNPFRINFAGTATSTAGPSIAVFDGVGTTGNQRTDNSGVFTFDPTQTQQSSATKIFTIANNGTSDMHNVGVVVSGANIGDFDVTGGTVALLVPNATAAFSVTFRPQTAGTRTATVTVSCSDVGVSPFRVNYSGKATTVTEARIDVFKGDISGMELANGVGAVAFPTTIVGNTATQTFTIENIGAVDLTNIAVTKGIGGNAGDFILDASTTAATLAASSTTTFTVQFKPTAVGPRTATIQIASSDSADNPFVINLTGQTHSVGFAKASESVLEGKVTLTIPVSISSAFGVGFSVPVTFLANPTSYAYTRTPTAASLSFGAAQTVSNITLTLADNVKVEANKTITITLGTPSLSGIVLGAYSKYTVTILDNAAPTVTITPGDLNGNQIAAAGATVGWVPSVTGSDPLTYSWKKGTTPLATTSSYTIPHPATIADAGAYTFTATNKRSPLTKTVNLVVVDQTSSEVRFDKNLTATMSVVFGGTPTSFKWYKKGTPDTLLSNGTKYANATTKTLSIKTLNIGDRGFYYCAVTGFASTVNGGVITLDVPDAAPNAVTVTFPDGVAYNKYTFQIPSDPAGNQVPTKFACSGLPAGLTCSTTGLVSGTPVPTALQAGVAVPLKVTLTNGVNHVDINTTIKIKPFPVGAVGTFVAAVDRHGPTSSNLGGRLDMVTTSTGSYTGTLTLGGSAYKLTPGTLMTDATSYIPTLTLNVTRTGTPVPAPVTLMVHLDPATNLLTGTVTVVGDVSSAPVNGWRNTWHTTSPSPNPVVKQFGLHAFELSLDSASSSITNAPKGFGYGAASVTNVGGTTVSGHVADSSAFASNGVLGPNGEVLLFSSMYTSKGSVTGTICIGQDATHSILPGVVNTDHPVATSIAWLKNGGVTTRDPSPYPGMMVLEATGGKYTITGPVGGIAPPGPGATDYNALLRFLDGGIGITATPPNVSFKISTANAATFVQGAQNPGKITALAINATTGAFSGTFTLTDTGIIRAGNAFQGQIVPNHGLAVDTTKGYGNFTLPQLPTTGQTILTSPKISGSVFLDEK